ncbi:MAG: NfeD family protein [Anaerolineae bacterium]|nr:NfeD family protein [Anaerolineae bacterium]
MIILSGLFLGLVVLLSLFSCSMAFGAISQLVGQVGHATTDLDPRGTVLVASELWTATAEDPPIAAGEAVEVVAVEGIKLIVRRITKRKETNDD